jgi:transposase-like protein
MIPTLFFYELGLVALVWLFLMLYWLWPNDPATRYPTRPQLRVLRKRSNAPKLFVGLTHRPHCALWEQDLLVPQGLPPAPPDPLPLRHRRPRTVDTSRHICPYDGCDYRGWLGLGNLRANGHPSGGPWRQFYCTSCKGYFLEKHGTLFRGKQAAVELIVRILACLAEGLGIRATARVFEVAPNTVLQWLTEAAEHLRALKRLRIGNVHEDVRLHPAG